MSCLYWKERCVTDAVVLGSLHGSLELFPWNICIARFDSSLLRGYAFLNTGSRCSIRHACRPGSLRLLSTARSRMHQEEALPNTIHHPLISRLPRSPDAFISLVYSVKLKADEIHKQRVKMEAQVKRQGQTRTTVSTPVPGSIPLPQT